ncbi:MAG: hypothetical protein JWQ27_1869 [Ferruginibacter sp.]|nr:hypothetical protein [Ferruginibacter sp.]
MYKLPHFTEHDQEAIMQFMQDFSLALVAGVGNDYPVATQLPLEVVEHNGSLFFTGHMMRNTDHHKAFATNEHVLVVFTSPSAVISANWYEQPTGASTINYMAVHAKGKIHFSDEAGTRAAIKQITDKHIGTDGPAAFEKLAPEYIDAMLKAIVGFSIEVVSLQNVFKLSQNRSVTDQERIIEKLEAAKEPGAIFIAAEMKKRLTITKH